MSNEKIYTECMTKVYDKTDLQIRHIVDKVNLNALFDALDVVETDESDNLHIQYCTTCEDAKDTSYSEMLYSVSGEAFFCDTDCLAEFILKHIKETRVKEK